MRDFFERNRFLIHFVLLTNLMGISIGMVRVGTSLFALHLGADAFLQGLIASAQTIGVMLVSIPIGIMVDRHGPGRLFAIGTVLVGTIYFIQPLIPNPWFLLAGTALGSLLMPLRFVSLSTVFMSQLDRVGEAKAGWYRGSHMSGMFLIGPILAATAVGLVGYVGTFWFVAFLFVLTLLFAPLVFRHYVVAEPVTGRFSFKDVLAQLALVGRNSELRLICLVEFTGQGINAFYTYFILIIAIDMLHLDALCAARLIGVEGFTFIFTLFFFGGPINRIGNGRSYLISLALSVPALLVLGLGTTLLGLTLAGALLGLCLGTLQIITLTRYARLGAQLGRGRIAGISSLMGPAGSTFGSLIGGLIGQHLGLQTVFLFFIPAVVLLFGWIALNQRQACVDSTLAGQGAVS